MTPEQLAAEQRAFLILAEKQSAVLLSAEFDALRREISDYLTANLPTEISLAKIEERNFLARFLEEISQFCDVLSIPLAAVALRAQKRVVNFTADSLKRYLPEIKTSIFDADREAIQKLINRTNTGESLEKAFSRLASPVAARAKQELIEGFSLGESSAQIAKRLNNATDFGASRAMTIARTETNEAYRAASREFYRAAEIRQYVWMSALDVRTCWICWHLHGRKFKTKQKVTSHPNCRCTLVPVSKNNKDVETGIERFLRLETGYQKQILGEKRFDLYSRGAEEELESFVGVKTSDSRGWQHFIKPLA
jgi:SPP1 gp7 family putative phage head morphogenesis protein